MGAKVKILAGNGRGASAVDKWLRFALLYLKKHLPHPRAVTLPLLHSA